MNIERLSDPDEVDDELVSAFHRLLPQLSESSTLPTLAHLRALVASEVCLLFIARDDAGRIIGTLTLAVFPIPSGRRAWIEDVVVEMSARGRGIGEALVREALRQALSLGATSVDLTSRPPREAANRLYRRLGFETRETNLYRYTLLDPDAPQDRASH